MMNQELIIQNLFEQMIKCLKAFSRFGAFLIFVVGLLMTGVTIWSFVNSELIFNQYTLLGILLGADILILIGACIGFAGLKRGNGCLICLFQVFVVIFLVVFLGIGIGAELLPKHTFNGDCNSSENQLIKVADQAFKQANSQLCHDACACSLTDQTIDNGYYTEAEKQTLRNYNRASSSAYKYQDCDSSKHQEQKYQDMFAILYSIEQALDCSQWCENQTPNLIYQFTDVNRGKPESYCYNTMKDKLSQYGNILGLCSFGVALFLLLVGLSNFLICCSPDRRSLSYRDRFVIYEDGRYRPIS